MARMPKFVWRVSCRVCRVVFQIASVDEGVYAAAPMFNGTGTLRAASSFLQFWGRDLVRVVVTMKRARGHGAAACTHRAGQTPRKAT
jgi:hypothetical protein